MSSRWVVRYSCESCGCDISLIDPPSGRPYWVDTRGSSLCPSDRAMFHAPNPIALRMFVEVEEDGEEVAIDG